MEEYRAKLKMYRAQELPKRILRFEACLIPTEEVICDASLFLQKYFLNEDGSPDQTKTPGLVLLPGYTDRHLALTGRTEPVPALHVADGGLGGASNVMVIGWDRARVNNKAHKIDMEQSHGVGVLRLSHDWDRLMMSHQSYAEKLRNQAEIRNPQTGSSFKAHNVRGKYVVKSDAIQDDWPLLAKELRLRVVANGRLAIFDLGIIVGLMVLGKTQEHVTKVIKDGKWNADLLGVEELEDESEKEDSSSDEESDGDDETNDERASGCSGDSDYNIGDDPEAPIDLTSDQQVERQQNQKRHPRRLYFQWRGYNTMSGAIQFDPQNRNTGYLDFANDDATVFEGHICTNDMGGEISFRGYGVPGICGPLTMNWNAFSHLASERAKVPEYVR